MAEGPKILIYDLELKPNIVSRWSLYDDRPVSLDQLIEAGGIICFAYRWRGKGKTQFVSEWTHGYSGMIKALFDLFDEADYVCGFNSIGFDDKHAKYAFWLEGLGAPSSYRTIDLLRVARKHFNAPSRKLDYLSQAKGIGSKVVHPGMKLWNEVLRPTTPESGTKARKLMAKYNRGDVDLTAQLLEELLPFVDSLNVPLYTEQPGILVCPRCGGDHLQSRGFAYTTAARYRRWQCQDCKGWLRAKRNEATSGTRPL